MEDIIRIFASLGSRKGTLNSPHLLDPMINFRNEKIKSWTHPASLILKLKDAISASPKLDFLHYVTTTHPPAIPITIPWIRKTPKITKLIPTISKFTILVRKTSKQPASHQSSKDVPHTINKTNPFSPLPSSKY